MAFPVVRRLIFILFLCLSAVTFGQADPKNSNGDSDAPKIVKARVYRDKNKPHIKGLSILASELTLFFVPKSDNLKSYVDLPLKFVNPGWKLMAEKKVLLEANTTTDSISIPIYLKPKMNYFILTAIGPNAEKEIENIYIFSPEDYVRSKSKLIWDKLLLSGGLAYLDYYQGGTGSYKSLTGLVSFEYATAPQFNPGLSYYFNVDLASPTVWETPVKAGSQLIEGKMDVGYFLLTDKTKSWRHQILAGGSYLTLFANSGPFGFANLIAPEFGYRVHYMLNDDAAFIFDFRYVALALPTKFDTYGINLNTAYTFKFSNNHRGQIGADLFAYQFSPLENRAVRPQMFKLKFGYSF